MKLCFCVFFLFSEFLFSGRLGEKLIAGREEAIKICEQRYKKASFYLDELEEYIDNMQYPGFFVCGLPQERYQKRYLAFKAAKLLNEQYTKFTNSKFSLRKYKTEKKLQNKVAEYASNCRRFSEGIINFAIWFMDPIEFEQKIKEEQKNLKTKELEVVIKSWEKVFNAQIDDLL